VRNTRKKETGVRPFKKITAILHKNFRNNKTIYQTKNRYFAVNSTYKYLEFYARSAPGGGLSNPSRMCPIITQNPKPKTQNPKPKTQNPKPKTKNQKPKTKNQKPKTKNQKPKTKNQKPKTKNQKPKKVRTDKNVIYFAVALRTDTEFFSPGSVHIQDYSLWGEIDSDNGFQLISVPLSAFGLGVCKKVLLNGKKGKGK
jgi:hypothetical protein